MATRAAPAEVKPGRGSRFPVRMIGIASAVLLIGGVAAGAAYLLRGDGADKTSPGTSVEREAAVEVLGAAGDSESGLPVRPPTRLTHPGGATAEVPSSEFVFSDWVDIRQVDPGDIGAGWEPHGSAWRFESRGGLTIPGSIRMTIPDAGAGPDARVVALTAPGSWAEVPANRTDGSFAFEVTNVPAPWLVVVATPVEVAYLPDDGPAEISNIESLYWSDREAWREQELAWIAEQDLSVATEDNRLLVSREASQLRGYPKVKADLEWALRVLGGARAVQEAAEATSGATGGILIPGAASAPQSVGTYRAGIARLVQVRREWVANRYSWARAEDSEGDTSIFRFDDAQTMDQAIESALARYAPWGVELTDHLLRSGYLETMDLRVLAPFGETYFTEVGLPAGAVATVDDAVRKVRTTGARDERRFLRLYSTRAIEDTSWIDYFKDWKSEGFVRYAPMALWALGLTSGGPLLVGFTVIDQLLSWYQNTEAVSTDPRLYSRVQDYQTGATGAGLAIDVAGDLLRTSHVAQTTISGQKLGAGQFVYALGLSLAVANTDWFMLQGVREMTEGSRTYCIQGRCNWFYSQNIPPIQVMASVRGDAPSQQGAYPMTRAKVMTWNMAFRGGTARIDEGRVVYSADLHQLFVDPMGRSELWAQADTNYNLRGKDALNALAWEPYRESSWPDVMEGNTPGAQAFRLAVPKSYLDAVGREFEIPAGSPLEDYGLVFVLEGPGDSGRNLFLLTKLAEPLPTDEKDTLYFSVVLSGDPALDLEGIDAPYAGQVQAADMKPLRRTLTGRLYAHTQERETWVEIPIEFTAANRLRQIDPEDVESPWVQYIDVSADVKPTVYRGTTSQGKAVEILVDFKAGTWEIQVLQTHLPAAVCGDPNSEDFFEGGKRSENDADWGTVRAPAKLVQPGAENYPQAVLILWITGGVVDGNTLAWGPVPPEVLAQATEESPAVEIRKLWGAEQFGTLDSSRRTLSGDLIVPFSDWFDCPVERFSYSATRSQ